MSSKKNIDSTLHLTPDDGGKAYDAFQSALDLPKANGRPANPKVWGRLQYVMNQNYRKLKPQVEAYREAETSIVDEYVRRHPDPDEYPDYRDSEKGAPIWRLPAAPDRDIVRKQEGQMVKWVFADTGENVMDDPDEDADTKERQLASQRNEIRAKTLHRDFGEQQDEADEKLKGLKREEYITVDVYFGDASLMWGDRAPQGVDFDPVLWCFVEDGSTNFDFYDTPSALQEPSSDATEEGAA